MCRVAVCVALLLVLAGCAAPVAEGPAPDVPEHSADADARPDPDSDVLGWEQGYWYDDPIPANNTDGLNESERTAAVARSMARVERLRGLEFEERVPVTVISRSNFSAGGTDRNSSAFAAFDNAKFEATFLVGEESDSLSVQESSRNQTVLGYYSPARDAIVVVSDSAVPTLDGERTLGHELVHALQDQHFNLSDSTPQTRDAYNARNALVEGDATLVQRQYEHRCGTNWSCLAQPASNGSGGGSGGVPHMGVYLLSIFPYTEGPNFASALKDGDSWADVDDAYDAPPETTTAVIYPDRYGSFEARNVSLSLSPTDGWERVRPPNRLDYAVLGQSALATTFAYTLYDSYNRSSVVAPEAFLNLEGASVNQTDPVNYDLAPTRGWRGDRLHVYRNGQETGYVWRLAWDSPADAERFAEAYRQLLAHWGGRRVAATTWRLGPESPFSDAFYLEVSDDTVTVVNAPETADLESLYSGAR